MAANRKVIPSFLIFVIVLCSVLLLTHGTSALIRTVLYYNIACKNAVWSLAAHRAPHIIRLIRFLTPFMQRVFRTSTSTKIIIY